MRNTHVRNLHSLYKNICTILQQHESVPQQPQTAQIRNLKHHKQLLETAFDAFKLKKNQITPGLKQKVENLEKYIHHVRHAKIVSSHHQMQNSAEMHSAQQLVPPHSRNSHADISEKKPTSQSSPQIFQVPNQFSSSQQQANEVSIIQGCGNNVQAPISGEKESLKSFIITTPGVPASPLLEECSNVNETSQNGTLISDDTSAAMQGLIKVLSSMSDEALMASSGEIGAVVCLNDCISTLEPLNVSPNSAIDKYLEGVNDADLRTRYLTCDDYVRRGREMSHIINSRPTSESFFHFTSQENYTLLEEIKKINNRLIDTEVVIDEEKTNPSANGGVDEHGGRRILVKLVFNSISVNVNLMSQYASSNKKSIIKPLRVLVPSSYPLCSPVILDEMPSKISKDLDNLSMKAKFKLRLSLQSLNQPMSLRDIATSWDRCAREAICEYAKLHGGGTFSSKYGGWEICHDGG
ncbi:hypothetical protein TanjilG_02827 [Lupinus angustifolius]|uniref:ARC105/Med15 mediator subunit C-terminal domain-containing protein n=1 Tax=Lupinus angustifolius TaxID=3871 RepID=A0A4P1RLP7_LUPAN|nr:PREDICTED: mediator of RNA polymerase II transcription subunit 15a-like [Lupinus angustifolius]OIW13307.1 hypothetical protein TanjilG_02827 [Lupinus angustifolius]